MSSGYDVVFPKSGRQQLDGGLNSKYERSLIADNESPDCYNVVFTGGAVETRPGVAKLNTATIGSFVGDGLYTRHDNTGAETMVAWVGGTAFALTGASTFTTIASAQSVFTAGVRVAAAEAENYMFFGNGGATPYKWNGTDFTRHGVPAPTQTAAVVSAAGGALSGTYSWKYTYVNSATVESDLGPAVTLTVAASSIASLTAVGTAPQSFGVAARYIYRTDASGSTYKRIGTINDNTTTTFNDTVSSAAAGVNAPTDNGVPPNYNAVAMHGGLGRLFMNDPANPNYVWYTPALQPYTVNRASAFIPIGDKSFDIVRTVDIYDNGVVVGCNRGVYLIVTPSNTATDWRVVRMRSQYGGKSPFGSFLYNNSLMFAAVENTKLAGFASISGSTIDQEATYLDKTRAGSDLVSNRIEPVVFQVPETTIANISAMVFKNKAYVAISYGSSQTTNNRVLIFDFSIANLSKSQRDAWSILSGVSAAQFAVYNNKLYFLDSTATGFVRQLETTSYADDGSAIDSYFWTKEFAGLPGHENLEKDFRYIKLLVEKTGAYFMNLTYRVDSDNSAAGLTQQVSLDPGSELWGSLVWGIGKWGAGNAQEEVRVSLGQASGKRIQFKFSNQNAASQRFKVHGINVGYNIKGKR